MPHRSSRLAHSARATLTLLTARLAPPAPTHAVKSKRNAFRSDDPEAEIPQHNWKQGPDFRSGRVEDAGYACVGSNRPKVGRFGGDAPSAREVRAEDDDKTCGRRIALSRCRSRRGSARRARAPATRPALVADPGSWVGRQWKKNGGVKQGLGRW